MSEPSLKISNAYWAFWIFVLFLVPELLAWAGVIPMYTLSHTSWLDEKKYSMLKTALFGFLMGLAVHIRFGTKLLRAEFGGMVIALMMHLMWGLL